MQTKPPTGRVQDYTDAFLVSFGVMLFVGLLTIMINYGWGAVVLVAWLLDCCFHRRAPWRYE